MTQPADLQTELSLLPTLRGSRVDSALAGLFPQYSRATWQHWLSSGQVLLDSAEVKNNYKLSGAELVRVSARLPQHLQSAFAQRLPLQVVYEDQELLVVDKTPGMAMHPGAGIYRDTLLNALLGRGAPFADLPRAGIVHRLDQDTSGLVAVAKSLPAMHNLSAQLAERSMSRSYLAVCENLPVAGGEINKPIARNPRNRIKMACYEPDEAPAGAKSALTTFRVLHKYQSHALLAVELQSGRTHQIRVHLASLGYPLVGDGLYGWRKRLAANMNSEQRALLQGFPRQALHAYRLRLQHPTSRRECEFTSPIPPDLRRLLGALGALDASLSASLGLAT